MTLRQIYWLAESGNVLGLGPDETVVGASFDGRGWTLLLGRRVA